MYYSTNNEAKQKYLAKIEIKSILFFGRNKSILNAVLGMNMRLKTGTGLFQKWSSVENIISDL